jgi:WD40 repeat protein
VPAKVCNPNSHVVADQFLTLYQAGDIHIWDRDSAVLLHHIRAQEVGGDMTCIAWNSAAEDPFMFGTGSHDGAVRIWSSPPPGASTQDEDSQSQRKAIPIIVTGTSSSFDSDVEYHRTDSPVQERTIAFASP